MVELARTNLTWAKLAREWLWSPRCARPHNVQCHLLTDRFTVKARSAATGPRSDGRTLGRLVAQRKISRFLELVSNRPDLADKPERAIGFR